MIRQKLNFNTKWLYTPNDNPDMKLPDYAEDNFEAVSIPHANRLLTTHKGDDFQEQIESYRFVSWYRRHFTLDSSFENKRMILEFEGIATVADVYVNGHFVGEHKGAYTSFSYDVTDFLNPCDTENIIAIRVDSTKHTDIPPEGNEVDYCLFGGIVRNVWMIATGKCYVTNLYSITPDIANGSSVTEHTIQIKNTTDTEKALSVEVSVIDAEKNVLSAKTAIYHTKANMENVLNITTDAFSNPILWHPNHPYLYTVVVKIYDKNICIDEYQTNIGYRYFEFKKDGFYLNSKKMKLIGVNRHEQWPYLGRAANDKHQKADADLVLETGFNIVRCSHYPQAPAFLDRCDEIGLLVFEEAPGWQHIGDESWKSIYMNNLEEMILRDRNHPSIVSWGTRVNESFDDSTFYIQTNNLAKTLDKTRPTHGVRRMESYGNTEFLNEEDIYTINYQYPQTPEYSPFIITEHTMDWFDGNGFSWATDKKALTFTKNFASVVDYYFGNALCLGGFAWSMFDYNNEVNYTKTGHVFYSGMYDIFRIEKMPAAFYRSQKNPNQEAFVFIANYWDDSCDDTVTVMSNCEEVSLFINDKFIAQIKPNLYLNLPHPMYEFKNIKFEAGTLTAIGYIDGKEVTRHTRKTPQTANRLLLTPDCTSILADGSDFTAIKIALTDKNGTILPYADTEVTISITGPGTFIGETHLTLEGGTGAFYVSSLYGQTGTIRCHVSAKDILDGNCEIIVDEFKDITI